MNVPREEDIVVPGDAVAEYIERHRRLIAPSTLDYTQGIVLSRAKGTRFWDIWRKEYLDFDASVAVAGIGHNHPLIAEMDQKQQEILDFAESGGRLWRLTIDVAGTRYEISEPAFAEALIPKVFPGATCIHKVIPTVSGKHAVEIAAALAFKSERVRPGKNWFVAFEKQFSGRLGWAGAFTYSKPAQKRDYPPTPFMLRHLPFPETYEDFVRARELMAYIPLDAVNAVLYEYVQGEGGINTPAYPFLHKILQEFKDHGALLICDEIQSGLGRTGKWFSFQHDSLVPDIVLVGKALGAGIPMAAVVYCASIFDGKHDEILESSWLGGTFHGYTKGIARAILVLNIIEKEGLVAHAAEMGNLLRAVLLGSNSRIRGSYACIPKGIGLMAGLEFRTILSPRGMPHKEARNRVLKELVKAEPVGILTLPAGMDDFNPTIRFLPPLVIQPHEIAYLKEKLSDALNRVSV